MLNIVVKVGESSTILFRNVEARRAITVEEAESLYFSTKSSFLIIENIREEEYEEAKELTSKIEDDGGKVIFYCPDNDETTCGLADETYHQIIMNMHELHKAIEAESGIKVNTNIHENVYDGRDGIATFDISAGSTEENDGEPTIIDEQTSEQEIEEGGLTIRLDETNSFNIGICEDAEVELAEVEGNEEEQLSEQRYKLIEKINKQKDLIRKLARMVKEQQSDASGLRDEIGIFKAKMAVLAGLGADTPISEIETRLMEITDLVKNNSITKEMNNLKEKVVSLELKNKELIEERARLGTEIGELKNNYGDVKKLLDEAEGEKQAALQLMHVEFEEKEKEESERVSKEIEGLRTSARDSDKIFKDTNTKLLEAEARIAELSFDMGELQDKYKKLYEDSESSITDVVELRAVNTNLQELLNAKNVQYDSLVAVAGTNGEGIRLLEEAKKSIERVNSTLTDNLTAEKEAVARLKMELRESNERASNYEGLNKQLNQSLIALGNGGYTGGITPIELNSSGRIICVTGCGSFGITTAAITIANKLCTNSRVLFIDMDLSYPKADGWFNMTPVIKGLKTTKMAAGSAVTGLSVLFSEGIQFFINNLNEIIRNVASGVKGGKLDYLSGLYNRIDSIKMLTCQYSKMFEAVCNQYDFVVVDCGKFGTSDIGDKVIKAISDVADRTVLISTSDKFEVRTFAIKLREWKIRVDKAFWLVNLCDSSTIDEITKKSISPMQYSLMPFDDTIRGQRMDFGRARVTKAKFDLFFEQLFG